jgi:ubiquinone/menaquinone biosynthesis C-methylase UbiE
MNLFNMKGAWSRPIVWLYTTFVVRGLDDLYDEGEKLLPPLSDGGRALDVGCGNGLAAVNLAKRRPGVRVVGVDLSDAMIELANQRGRGVPNVRFEVADAMALPFSDASFDLCVSIASVKHWPDQQKGVNELHRVLKRGGSAFVLEANRECDRASAERFVARWRIAVRPIRPIVVQHFLRIIAAQGMAAADLVACFEQAGFTGVNTGTVPGYPLVYAVGTKR